MTRAFGAFTMQPHFGAPADQDEALRLAVEGGMKEDVIKKLYKNQKDNVERSLIEYRAGGFGVLNADPVGTGKTLSGIAVACMARGLMKEKGPNMVVFCVPTNVATYWLEEIRKHAPRMEKVCVWKDLSDKSKNEIKDNSCDALIITHGALRFAYSKLKKSPGSKSALFELKLAALIVDESHLFRNQTTHGFKGVMKIAENSQIRNCLSGTPYQNKMEDFVAQMKICNSRPEFQNIETFKNDVSADVLTRMHNTSMMEGPPLKLKVTLTRNVDMLTMPEEEKDVLKEIMRDCVQALVIYKQSKTSDEKKQNYMNVLKYFMKIRIASVSSVLATFDDVNDPEADALDAVESENAAEEEGGDLSNEKAAAQKRRIDAIVSNKSKKMEETLKLAQKRVGEGHKVIVFCNFVDPLFALSQLYGSGSEVYSGRLNQSKRDALIKRFRDDPSLQVLFMTTLCGGTGLNMQMASAIIHMDTWWNPSLAEQVTGRMYRNGQTKNCFVDFIRYRDSFDDTCTKLYAERKQENADKLKGNLKGKDVYATVIFDTEAVKGLLLALATCLELTYEIKIMKRIKEKEDLIASISGAPKPEASGSGAPKAKPPKDKSGSRRDEPDGESSPKEAKITEPVGEMSANEAKIADLRARFAAKK